MSQSKPITQAQLGISSRQMTGERAKLLAGELTYEQFKDKERAHLGKLKQFREQNNVTR